MLYSKSMKKHDQKKRLKWNDGHKNNHSLTWLRQRAGHATTQPKHLLHNLLFNVHVLAILLTFKAFLWQTISHLPHNVHLSMSHPTLQRELYEELKTSEISSFPSMNPTDEPPPRYLK